METFPRDYVHYCTHRNELTAEPLAQPKRPLPAYTLICHRYSLLYDYQGNFEGDRCRLHSRCLGAKQTFPRSSFFFALQNLSMFAL